MRLIDADKALYMEFEEMMQHLEHGCDYDVDKVVEQLDKNAQKMSEAKAIRPYAKRSPADHRYYKAISVKKAKEIVKAGGVDG